MVSTDLYSNRNYENHVLVSIVFSQTIFSKFSFDLINQWIVKQSPSGVSNSYLTYHTEGSHPSNYSEQSHYNSGSPTSHSSHLHYNSPNSGQSYGQPVSQYNEMYDTCSPYAANIPPAIRQPIPSSNIKYWNSDQMSHNSHNYNQGIPPPPLVSRNQSLVSPPLRSPHCSAGNNYSGSAVPQQRSSSQSPQDWSRSPNVMSSPSTTPSPISQHTSVNRSPSHMSSVPSQQFSPNHSSHSNVSDAPQQSVQKRKTGIVFNNQNHTSSPGSASNPLQSLQKMVMTESDNSEGRTSYNNNGSNDINSNTTLKPYNNNNDQNMNNDPDSPYPTYYNLDQNRLCTPPHPTPNLNSNDIPDKEVASDGQLNESVIELKNGETNDTKSSNGDNDLIYSNLDKPKAENVHRINSRVVNNLSETSFGVNGEIPLKKMNSSLPKSEVSNELSQEVMTEHMIPPIVCKRTESRDSLQSSDSETAHSVYGESRAPHIWQMEKEYYNRYSDQKGWSQQQWQHNNNLGQNPRMPQNNYLSSGGQPSNSSPYQTPYRPTQCGSWAPSVSSSQSSTPAQEFAPPTNMRTQSGKKKRGRPFGSKNRRNSDDNNSEANPSDTGSSTKKSKKVITQEIGINTSVSVDPHGFDELAVVNPLKQTSKRKKTVGPFIRMEKMRGRQCTRFSIVNASSKPEDEKDVKIKAVSTKTEPIKLIRRPSLLATSKKVVSTLSPHYDLNTSDKSWVCALCHKGPHYKGLGDLFGPYSIQIEDKNKLQMSCAVTSGQTSVQTSTTIRSQSSLMDSYDKTIDSVIGFEQKSNEKKVRRRKSESSDETANKGRPKQCSKVAMSSQNCETETITHSSNSEVWVHEDCIVWSNGVYLIGHRIKNLEEVIIESNESVIIIIISFFSFKK